MLQELSEVHVKSISQALNLTLNESKYDEAIDLLRPVVADHAAHPTIVSLLTMISVLRTLDMRLGFLESGLYATLQTADPAHAYFSAEFIGNEGGHFHRHYHAWRTRRLRKLVSLLGNDLSGKSILVLGDGIGVIGGFIASLGARVVALEGREENRRLANMRFGKSQGYNYESVLADLNDDFSFAGRFDCVVAFGIMEVLWRIDSFMASCAGCSDDIILETLVCDSLDPQFTKPTVIAEGNSNNDEPLYGKALWPSPSYVERRFQELGFATERHLDPSLNVPSHIYDWKHGTTKGHEGELRRFWRFRKTS